MKRIDHPTALNERFTNGNPAQGVPATVVNDDWLNGVQEELMAVITAAGLDPEGDDLTQLKQAIRHLAAAKSHGHKTAEITDLLSDIHIWQASQRYTQRSLTISQSKVTWDVAAHPFAVLILTTDVTGFTLTNMAGGMTGELTILQDATGGRTCVTPTGTKSPAGKALEISDQPNGETLVNISVRDNAGTPVPRLYSLKDFAVVS